MYTRGKNWIGYEMGYIYVSEEINRKAGMRRFILKCKKCGAEKKIYHNQLSSGNWNVCQHDLDDIYED